MSELGVTIGTYRLLAKLGEGGMGVVYLGEHTLLGRRAAIKVLLPAWSANEEIVHRFFNEARAVTRIADPGIVQIFDFGYHTDGSAFIVMELLEGEPMDRRLQRVGRLGLGDSLRFMRLICSSLGAAHAKGIVHRDLKPENLFLVGDTAVTGGERVKLLDFGIAKLSSDEPGTLKTRTGAMMGTPVYMSPEQCRGAGDIDHRSDIYSIACVMFTMLTGRPPFLGESTGDLIVAHLRESPPLAGALVPGLPPIVDDLLQRCLRKLPAERFGSMAELVQMLGFAEQALHAPGMSAQLPIAAPAGLLPRASGAPNAPVVNATTLAGAASQRGAATLAPQRAGRRQLGGIVLAAVVVAGVGFAALRGGGEAAPTGASAAGTSGRDPAVAATAPVAVTPARAPAAAAPAAAAPSASDPAAAAPPPVIQTMAPSDAGPVDAAATAAASATAPINAAASPPQPVKPRGTGPRSPSTKGDHASTRASPASTPIDRGD